MKDEESQRPLKVGDLAQRTGLSVRTLHYYEEVGLLVPSHRTGSSHRLYSAEDVLRLQKIKSLRALGFTLDQVRTCLGSSNHSTLEVMEKHLAQAREHLALQQQLVDRLEHVTGCLRDGALVDVEELIRTIEVMTMWEKRVTAEQRAEVHERASEMGRDQVRAVEQEWVQNIAKLRVEMAAGTDPKDERVQTLTKRNRELVRTFSGGNAGIETTLREAYRAGAGTEHGMDAELREYLERAAR